MDRWNFSATSRRACTNPESHSTLAMVSDPPLREMGLKKVRRRTPPARGAAVERPNPQRRRLSRPKLVFTKSSPRERLTDHDSPPHRPQLEAYRRAKERRAEEAIRRTRERRAGAPVPFEEHAANDGAPRRVPTANSGASSGWRRASVAGSSRRGRDRACERTVADISSLRAFTGLLDAAADDDDDDVRVDASRGLPEREPRRAQRVRGTDAESTENDRLSSENARLREEVARLEGMVDALMMLVDRHGIDASGTGQTKEDAGAESGGNLESGDSESGDDEEDDEAPPIGDCDSMLEHWLRNHCVPAAAERLSGEREGTPVSAATRTGGGEENGDEHTERALADSPFEYHARDERDDEREGEARKMPEEFAKGKVTAKKEEVLTPEAPTRVKTFS